MKLKIEKAIGFYCTYAIYYKKNWYSRWKLVKYCNILDDASKYIEDFLKDIDNFPIIYETRK